MIYYLRLNAVTPGPPILSLESFPRTHQTVPMTQGLDGCFVSWREVLAPAAAQSPSNSASLQRQPAVQSGVSGSSMQSVGPGTRSGSLGITFVRGKGSYMPFRPGGLEDGPAFQDLASGRNLDNQAEADSGFSNSQESGSVWRAVAPSLGRGLHFPTGNSDKGAEVFTADELLKRMFGEVGLNPKAIRKTQTDHQNAQGMSGLGGDMAIANSVSQTITIALLVEFSVDSHEKQIDRLHQKLDAVHPNHIDDLLPITVSLLGSESPQSMLSIDLDFSGYPLLPLRIAPINASGNGRTWLTSIGS